MWRLHATKLCRAEGDMETCMLVGKGKDSHKSPTRTCKPLPHLPWRSRRSRKAGSRVPHSDADDCAFCNLGLGYRV